jgi:cell division protein FtsB
MKRAVNLSGWKAQARQVWLPAIAVLVVAWAAYHTLHGKRGLIAYHDYTSQAEALTAEAAATRAEREMLERQIAALKDGSVDQDFLDEQVRRQLGFVDKDEFIVPIPQGDSLK